MSAPASPSRKGPPAKPPPLLVRQDYMYRVCGRGIAKRWKRRYLCLDLPQTSLVEYTSATKQTITKIFPMSQISALTLDGLYIEFTFADRRIKLRASSVEHALEWHTALGNAMQQFARPQAPALAANARARAATDSPMPSFSQRRQSAPSLDGLYDPGSSTKKDRDEFGEEEEDDEEEEEDDDDDDDDGDDNSSNYETQASSTEDDGTATQEQQHHQQTQGSSSSNSGSGVQLVANHDAKQLPAKSWATSIRSMFSSTASQPPHSPTSLPKGDSLEAAPASSAAGEGGASSTYEVSSHQIYEYDTVEVFENQRWLPISHWGTIMLLHDRMPFTNRLGKPRMDWYKASLIGDGQLAANTATTGLEDRTSNSQVHVIRSPWEWHGSWRLSPLPALVSTRPATASIEEEVSTDSLLSPRAGGGGGGNGDASTTDGVGWAVGFDFPDFDYAIARGVARELPSAKAIQVRTRRWVRVRRRALTIMARTPSPLPLPLIVPLLDYNHQELMTGYLGSKHHAGWHSRYYKLVRVCDGIWDDGLGHGLVNRSPTEVLLIEFESKERQTRKRTYKLDGSSMASLVIPLQPGENVEPVADLTIRFVEPHSHESVSEEPRVGRFTCAVRSKAIPLLLTADCRAEALRWVRAINAITKDLAVDPSQAEPMTPKRHHTLSLRFGSRPKSTSKEEFDEEELRDFTEGGGKTGGAVITTTGETPVACEGAPKPWEATGRLKEIVNVTLPVSPMAFFQIFIGDKAPAGLSGFHTEFGDDSVVSSKWALPAAGEERQRDEYDVDGWDTCPERLITFKALTHSTIPPPVTRAEKHMRYWWYPIHNVLLVKATTFSLDVPMADSFHVVELWIIQPENNATNKIRCRILMDVPFSKSFNPLKGTIQLLVTRGSQKTFLALKRHLISTVSKLGGAAQDGDESEAAEEDSHEEIASEAAWRAWISPLRDVVGLFPQVSWRDLLVILFMVWIVWWMTAMLQEAREATKLLRIVVEAQGWGVV